METSHDIATPEAVENRVHRFGDYELIEEIARGGMGIVYRARQISLDRIVALKLLPFSSLTSAEHIQRFRAEASAAAALHHPNIVTVHEVGVHQGQHYLVMNLVNGPPLSRLVSERSLPGKRAAGYMRQIAEAVHYAHEKGILHRDLKPSNVLIDENDQPQVTDFGLAKRLDGESTLTLTGQALGSPGYMPPEQASGERGKVSRRSDVYGLGAMLYHMLTGRPPFQATLLSEAIQQVLNEDPVSPRVLNPSVPRDLETICLKCLEKESERRYQTAREVVEELERFLTGEPIAARPIGRAGKMWRWSRRNPVVASLTACVAMLLLVLAIGGPIVAARQRALAETYRRVLYAQDLKAAQQAWEDGNMREAVTNLDRHVPLARQEDLREFTWRYLRHLCQPYLATPTLDHGFDIFCMATTRDGKRLAVSGGTDLVTIWDLASRSKLYELQTGEPILAGPLAFSPDDKYLLASGLGTRFGSTNGVQIWNTTTWERVHKFDFSGAYCDFSPDGSLLAAPATNQVALVHVGGDWLIDQWLAGHTNTVWSARFSPQGRRLVTACSDHTARIWNVATGEQLGQFTNHGAAVTAATFLPPDGRRVVSVGVDGYVRLWDASSFRELSGYSHETGVGALEVSPDGKMVASGGDDGLVQIYDVDREEMVRTLRGHSQRVEAVKFVLDGTTLASGSRDGTVKLWNLRNQPPPDVMPGCIAGSPLAFTPDSRLLATVSSNATDILFWTVVTGELKERLFFTLPGVHELVAAREAAPTGSVRILKSVVVDLAVSSNRVLAVHRSFDLGLPAGNLQYHRIELWDLGAKSILHSFPGKRPMSFSPEGRLFACQGPGNGEVQIRDVQTARTLWRLTGIPSSHVSVGLAFSPDGRTLASGGLDTLLWDLQTGRQRLTLRSVKDGQAPVDTPAFTPDGELLVSGGPDFADILVWEMSDLRRAPHKLRGHLRRLRSLAISPDSRTLASGHDTGLIKLWSLEWNHGQFVGREFLSLRDHEDAVNNLQFSPDGAVLASSSADGTVRLWRAEPVRR